jgi:hypothetical protein
VSATKFTTTALTPATTTKFAAELADGSKGHVLHSALAIYSTFTPVFTFATPGDLAITYSSQVGTYRRIGNLVEARINLAMTTFTHTTASGAASISGLPFTSRNVTNDFAYGIGQWTGVTFASASVLGATALTFRIAPNASSVALVASGSAISGGPLQVTDVPTAGLPTFRFLIAYEAA